MVPPAVPVVVFALISLVPFAHTLSANLRKPRGEGELTAFAQRTVLSLIAFAILANASLLIAR